MIKCDFCKQMINTKKDRYVHVEDWDRENFVKDLWAHLRCFNKAMNRDLKQVEKQAKHIIDSAGHIVESDVFKEMFPKKQEVYEIK